MERKLATALFADLVDSTGLGEQDPERTRVLLERFYDTLSAEIELAGGTVEKFAGDAVMAVFGAPAAHEDHAERALHAALSLLRRVDEVFDGALQVRVGVNSGEVVVGQPRAGSSFVTGDAVNVAARLEQAAAPGQVLAGERTVALARGAFEFGPEQAVDAKGKAAPVPCRAVLRALTLMRPRGVSGLRATFVGRDAELELGRATYRRTLELETPHLVTIFGDAGVGKTRLVRELWLWLAEQEPEPRRRTGRCLAYGHATYWAIGEIVKEDLDIRDSDSDEDVARRLGEHGALGLALGRADTRDASPMNVRDDLQNAAVSFFERLASGRPAVVLIEDLHWADNALLDLIERVMRDARGPLLLVATSRPELLDARPSWGAGRRNATTVWLEPLAEAEAARLVDELPKELRDGVVARAEGNPFFVEELVSSLLDRGVLRRGDGWETAAAIDWATVPDTVHALLASRIDLLDPDAKATLQAASVIGRAFWQAPLRELLGSEPMLTSLEDRDFVRRRGGSSMSGDVEYVFRHALTREVAYGSLPKANRASLHAQLATWLEDSGGGRDEHAPLLAHHYTEAARPEDVDLAWPGDRATADRLRRAAVKWLRRAAQLSISRYDLAEAVAMLEHAAALDTEGEDLAGIWRDIGRAHALRYDGVAFAEAMERSLALTDDVEARDETLAEMAYATSFRVGMFATVPEDATVDGWIADVLASPTASATARAKTRIAEIFWSDGGLEEAREAVRLANRAGNVALRSAAARAEGYAALKALEFQHAYEKTLEAMELLEDQLDREEQGEAHEQLVIVAVALGRIDEARARIERQDELVRPLSPHHRVHAIAVANEAAGVFGEWERILGLRDTSEERIEANRETPCGRHGNVTYLQAIASESTGDAEGARRFEALARSRVRSAYSPTVSTLQAQLALARGEIESAVELTPEAFDPLLARRWWWFAAPSTITYLDVRSTAGRRDDIELASARVLEEKCPILQPFALRALGRVRRDDGLLREAAARFREMGLDARERETSG